MQEKLSFLPHAARPLLVAHRGLSALAPENTMAAFAMAADHDIDTIELDIRLTRDGQLAVSHDADTSRTTACTSHMRIAKTCFSKLASLDVGSWKSGIFAGEAIPLLADVFSAFATKLNFICELKSENYFDSRLPQAFAECANSFRKCLESRIVAISFNPILLAKIARLATWIPLGFLHMRGIKAGIAQAILRQHALPGLAAYFPEANIALRKTSYFLRTLPAIPWTVNDPNVALRLLEAGCAGVISDCPHILKSALHSAFSGIGTSTH